MVLEQLFHPDGRRFTVQWNKQESLPQASRCSHWTNTYDQPVLICTRHPVKIGAWGSVLLRKSFGLPGISHGHNMERMKTKAHRLGVWRPHAQLFAKVLLGNNSQYNEVWGIAGFGLSVALTWKLLLPLPRTFQGDPTRSSPSNAICRKFSIFSTSILLSSLTVEICHHFCLTSLVPASSLRSIFFFYLFFLISNAPPEVNQQRGIQSGCCFHPVRDRWRKPARPPQLELLALHRLCKSLHSPACPLHLCMATKPCLEQEGKICMS